MTHPGQQRPIHLDQPSILIEQESPPPRIPQGPPPPPPPPIPITHSPYELVIAEDTLTSMLVKQYGWSWTLAGHLRRPER